jgi:hypothetical protein
LKLKTFATVIQLHFLESYGTLSMSKIEKLKERLLRRPKDFTFDELRTLLCALGYNEEQTGKTAGSRVAFRNPNTAERIRLHRPHPGLILKQYQVGQVIEALRAHGRLI